MQIYCDTNYSSTRIRVHTQAVTGNFKLRKQLMCFYYKMPGYLLHSSLPLSLAAISDQKRGIRFHRRQAVSFYED